MRNARIRPRAVVAIGVVCILGVPAANAALVPEPTPEVPVLSAELGRGTGVHVGTPSVPPGSKVVDGEPADWVGEPTGFGGTAVYSAGEYVYQDHLFDARGADDGTDAERIATYDALTATEERTYRVEPLIGQDAPSQFGIDTPAQLKGDEYYGDFPLTMTADIVETRFAVDGGDLVGLVRTSEMLADTDTHVIVLADTAPGSGVALPAAWGLATTRADVAFEVNGNGGATIDLATGSQTALPVGSVRSQPAGWTNAVEFRLPAATLGLDDGDPAVSVAVATRRSASSGVANVAFRFDEKVRTWFERGQALALHEGTIDGYFTDLDLPGLVAGRSQQYLPEPGYHDRIFRSADGISREQGLNGVWQHYGLYLPDGWATSGAFPLQWWFHWRGGHAHSAASVIPRMFRTLGDGEAPGAVSGGIADSIVVAPRGRGTSTWYVGWGQADFLEVWSDVFALLGEQIDDRRVYVTGHSMGGWASYLFPILYPDRFAGVMPYAGPVTQGAWTGVDFDGCDEFQWDGSTPCYIEANGSRPRDQHTRPLLENLRHVPISVMQGAADELVPVSGVTRQVERLVQLGYRHRYYLFPAYEHFSHPIADEWTDAGRYVHQFAAPENPARVTYIRNMAFERATEQVQASGFVFDFTFDSAYWMRGLTPAPGSDEARFDGRSAAVVDTPVLTTPEAGGPAPGQYGPFVMTGLAWTPSPLGASPTANGFEVDLTGAGGVELDVDRMGLDAGAPVSATVTTSHALVLRLAGGYTSVPPIACDCVVGGASLDGGTLVISLPAGTSNLTIG